MYGFSRFHQGRDKGAYFDLCFVRGHRSLVRNMTRRKIKNNRHEPRPLVEDHDFYHEAWTNHFEASVPAELLCGQSQSDTIMKTENNNELCEKQEEGTTSSPSIDVSAELVGLNIVVPSPTESPSCIPAQVEMTGTTADASVISDDLSLALDVSSLFGQDEEYRDVAFLRVVYFISLKTHLMRVTLWNQFLL